MLFATDSSGCETGPAIVGTVAPPGARPLPQRKVPLPDGTYDLIAVLDSGNILTELNEANNLVLLADRFKIWDMGA